MTFRGTKKEAEAFLTKKLGESDKGSVVLPSRRLLGDYLREWLKTTASMTVSRRTLEDYTWIIDKYIVPRLGGLTLKQLGLTHIQRFVADLFGQDSGAETNRGSAGKTASAPALSARTIRYAYSILHNALGHAVRAELIASNPAEGVTLPKKVKYEAQPLDGRQAQKFLAAAEGTRWYVLWVLMLAAGLRPGEALALQWTDVDFDSGTLNIRRALARLKTGEWLFKEPKSKQGRRILSVPPTTMEVLRRHRAIQDEERRNTGEAYEDRDLVLANRKGDPLDQRLVRAVFS